MAIASAEMKHISLISDTLEKILLPSFGPNSLNTMVMTSTGQLLVTSESGTILQALNLAHPFGKLILESVRTHLTLYGDEGKIFILLLSKIMTEINRIITNHNTSRYVNRSQRSHLIHLLHGFRQLRHTLPSIMDKVTSQSICFDLQTSHHSAFEKECYALIWSQLQCGFPIVLADKISHVLTSLLFDGMTSQNLSCLPRLIYDCWTNFDVLYLEATGLPSLMMKILDGFIVQRDFLYLHSDLSDQHNPKIILLGSSLSDNCERDSTVLTIQDKETMERALNFSPKHVHQIVKIFRERGISLVMSSVRISSVEVAAFRNFGISCVQMVDEEELSRLAVLLNVHILYLTEELFCDSSSYIGRVAKCTSAVIGRQRFVHLLPDKSKLYIISPNTARVMRQILITGPSKGVCYHIRTRIKKCFRYIHTWLVNGREHSLGCNPSSNERVFEFPHLNTKEIDQSLPRTSDQVTNARIESKSRNNTCRDISANSSGCVYHILGGGAFEIYLHKELNTYARNSEKHSPFWQACVVLAKATAAVPMELFKKSHHPKAKIYSIFNLIHDVECYRSKFKLDFVGINGRTGEIMNVSECMVRESLISKIATINHVLELVLQILNVDQIVSVTKLPEKEILDDSDE